jgi:23S rRNA (uracil1939-C5)-methyltransferase
VSTRPVSDKSKITHHQSTTNHQSKIIKSTIRVVDIVDIDRATGDGIARLGRQAIAVPFTIPGERVRVATRARRDGRFMATPLEVLRPSPHRVAPLCPHFAPPDGPACGGCAWQHIAYDEQLRLKTELVARLVRDVVPRSPAPRPMIAPTPRDAPWHYRQKVHFVFDSDSRRGLVMGHYARGSRRVVPIRECPVHDERGNVVAAALRDACLNSGAGRTLKSIAVRVAAEAPETMATIVVSSAGDKRLRAATTALLAAATTPTSLHLNVHPQDDAFIFGRETRHLAGAHRLRDAVHDVSFLISPTAFFQTNVRGAAVLVRLVLDAVPSRSAVLDLYAGAGLFALPLARRGETVVAVEESRAAVADGIASRDLNRIPADRCTFIAAPVERIVAAPGTAARALSSRALSRVDAVVLDPPREGCSAVVIDGVFGKIGPRTAVYVSCNPETLARDLGRIVRHGYDVKSIQPVDMFPHTAHVEAVAILEATEVREGTGSWRSRQSAGHAEADLRRHCLGGVSVSGERVRAQPPTIASEAGSTS